MRSLWAAIKLLAPDMPHIRAADAVFHGAELFICWCQELRTSLATRVHSGPRHPRNEFMAWSKSFWQPVADDDEATDRQLPARGSGARPVEPGRQAHVDKRNETLRAHLPTFACGYIGLADQ
jgi:hypothetical protein